MNQFDQDHGRLENLERDILKDEAGFPYVLMKKWYLKSLTE